MIGMLLSSGLFGLGGGIAMPALMGMAVSKGARIVRVHDVAATVDAVLMAEAVATAEEG